MKYHFLLILFLFFKSTCFSQIKEGNLIRINSKGDTLVVCGFPVEGVPVISSLSKKLYADINIFPITKDSIVASVSIINDSSCDFFLYSPILPGVDTKIMCLKIVEVTTNTLLDYKGIDTAIKYYFGNSSTLPYIIPCINDSNLILLRRFSKINFTYNISKAYNFQDFLTQKLNKFRTGFLLFMPLIKENKQIFEVDSYDNISKPVFIEIRSMQPPKEIKIVNFTVPQ